jgi:hypothetical protein
VKIRADEIQRVGVAISDALDEAGFTPHEQIAALGALLSLALAALPPAERKAATAAHIAALTSVRSDNRLVRQ